MNLFRSFFFFLSSFYSLHLSWAVFMSIKRRGLVCFLTPKNDHLQSSLSWSWYEHCWLIWWSITRRSIKWIRHSTSFAFLQTNTNSSPKNYQLGPVRLNTTCIDDILFESLLFSFSGFKFSTFISLKFLKEDLKEERKKEIQSKDYFLNDDLFTNCFDRFLLFALIDGKVHPTSSTSRHFLMVLLITYWFCF